MYRALPRHRCSARRTSVDSERKIESMLVQVDQMRLALLCCGDVSIRSGDRYIRDDMPADVVVHILTLWKQRILSDWKKKVCVSYDSGKRCHVCENGAILLETPKGDRFMFRWFNNAVVRVWSRIGDEWTPTARTNIVDRTIVIIENDRIDLWLAIIIAKSLSLKFMRK